MALPELRVEITADNVVKIWDDANPISNSAHFIEQPFGDHGVLFASTTEAQAWADDYCERHMAAAIYAEENPEPNPA